MKNIKYIIAAIIFIGLSSCDVENLFTTVREIDIPEHERKLSINTSLTGDSMTIFISHSKEIDDESDFSPIEAKVSLKEDGNEILNFDYNSENNLDLIIDKKLDEAIKEGKEYSLTVDSKKFGTATASEIVPKNPVIESLDFNKEVFKGEFGEYYKFSCVINDEKDVENYYFISFRLSGLNRSYLGVETKDPQLKKIFIRSDLSNNYHSESFFLVSDKSFDGNKRKVLFEIDKPYYGNNNQHKYKIVMQVNSVTKSYYNYVISRDQARSSNDNPFTEPVVIIDNIENGYGIFNVYAYKKYVIFEN